ncbi:hypothetical protein Barb4_01608 [Bacteroidales bacterium Barb4]|nr:hypothetical protein Barb4_01608 [Bacteroidales bacterium Barb4]
MDTVSHTYKIQHSRLTRYRIAYLQSITPYSPTFRFAACGTETSCSFRTSA